LGILIFKGLTARRLYKSFGVKGLKSSAKPQETHHTILHGGKVSITVQAFLTFKQCLIKITETSPTDQKAHNTKCPLNKLYSLKLIQNIGVFTWEFAGRHTIKVAGRIEVKFILPK
jgi:hypothetical protein